MTHAMKIMFLVYHGFSDVSGISKKIHSQVKGLRESGHDVRLCYYGFAADGHRCRYVDGQVLRDYGAGRLAGLLQRMDYGGILSYCVREGVELVYARCFQNASPWLISFFRRLREAGVYAVTEIPTYPYDAEFKSLSLKDRLGLRVDRLFRRRLYRQMDALVTFSDAEQIFGQRTIRISNGVDLDSIPVHAPTAPWSAAGGELRLIGVAEVHPWHAFDRVIAGMGEYYARRRASGACAAGQRQPDICFHIVGGVHPAHMERIFKPLIERYHLRQRVVFHGQLFGERLDDVFNQCHFAIGSLGRHRSGITVIKTLKNREYATRGIPFIYSEQDSDFDRQPYVIKAPADESPVDMRRIISFMDHFTMQPLEIRKTVERLSWKIQMQRVVDELSVNIRNLAGRRDGQELFPDGLMAEQKPQMKASWHTKLR